MTGCLIGAGIPAENCRDQASSTAPCVTVPSGRTTASRRPSRSNRCQQSFRKYDRLLCGFWRSPPAACAYLFVASRYSMSHPRRKCHCGAGSQHLAAIRNDCDRCTACVFQVPQPAMAGTSARVGRAVIVTGCIPVVCYCM